MRDAIDPLRFRVPVGPVDLTTYDAAATPGFDGGGHAKSHGHEALRDLGTELADLQERFFAEGRAGGSRSLLVVLQGMDTSGKGGVVRHVFGMLDPQALRIASFKPPTRAERSHDFLWRIERALADAGRIAVFDRSHYEDVLIARVRELAPAEEIERRYGAINDFEQRLVSDGTVVLKVMLHVSLEEQRDRLEARLDDPTKHWKYNPGDVDERGLWGHYRSAYEVALERTNTEVAPWFLVPADHKWFRNLTVGHLLLDTLRRLDPQWPAGDIDIEAERERLSRPVADT